MTSITIHDPLQYDNFLETHLRDVESERRQRQPIDWPPIEVILHIFTMLVSDDDDDDDHDDSDDDSDHNNNKSANNREHPEPHACHHPLAPPPIILSHVCRKWRAIALSNPILWSRIRYTTSSNHLALLTFLDRSANNPLDITFHSPLLLNNIDFLDAITIHSNRWRSVKLRCLNSAPIHALASTLADTTRTFPYLTSLDLAHLQSKDGSRPIFRVPDILAPPRLDSGTTSTSTAASTLHYLRLEKVPLYIFGTLISNVTHLELCQPLHKWYGHRTERSFYLFGLLEFLGTLPVLEDFILIDTTRGPRQTVFTLGDPEKPVQLLHLKRIEWSCPYPTAIHQFLSSIHAPSLDRLDLLLDDQPMKKIVRSANYVAPASFYDVSWTDLLTLHSLKDLSIHYADQDTLAAVSRHMNFPSLHTLELVNMHTGFKPVYKWDTRRVEFPRIDFLFRDPRLPHLTRLTISHFEVEVESASTMLVYMPSLTALYLDTCTGLPAFLTCLARGPGEGTARNRKAALCPGLETLSFWNCADLELAELLDVVTARNVVGRGDDENDTKKTTEIPERKIKPLRRLCGPRPAVEDTIPAAHITFVRLKRCPLITEDDALSLMDHGVNDVLWNE